MKCVDNVTSQIVNVISNSLTYVSANIKTLVCGIMTIRSLLVCSSLMLLREKQGVRLNMIKLFFFPWWNKLSVKLVGSFNIVLPETGV